MRRIILFLTLAGGLRLPAGPCPISSPLEAESRLDLPIF
jgi:hypothetical protein